MKRTLFLIGGFILASFLCLAQQGDVSEQVAFENADSIETIHITFLVGKWYNTSGSVTALQPDGSNSGIVSPNKTSFIEISGGGQLTIRDNWVEDYRNSLKNCRWVIVENQLVFQSPELGRLPVSFVRDKDKLTYHLYCHGFKYTRKIQLR